MEIAEILVLSMHSLKTGKWGRNARIAETKIGYKNLSLLIDKSFIYVRQVDREVISTDLCRIEQPNFV